MSCGCKDRAQAIVAAAIAVSKGDAGELARQADRFASSVRQDLGALKRAAAARMGVRRG